jgi:hypothetical protein
LLPPTPPTAGGATITDGGPRRHHRIRPLVLLFVETICL